MAEALTPTAILAELRTVSLPRTVVCHATVGSTMDLARELLLELDDAALPLLVTAEEQTAGRGRLGRRWEAPFGSALLLSLALRPTWLAPAQGTALVWMTAVALCEAVEATAGIKAALKWPNDLLLPDGASLAKAAGMLLEVNLSTAGFAWAILGCGVNVSAAPPPGATPYPATSVSAAAGAPISRLTLLRALLERLDHWHERLRTGDHAGLFFAWEARLHSLGKLVQVTTPSGVVVGVAEGVEADGTLLVRNAAGGLHRITTGDVGLGGQA